jgi:hypothetical protein
MTEYERQPDRVEIVEEYEDGTTIVGASVEDGWAEVEGTALSRATSEKPLAVLRRAGVTRMLSKFAVPGLDIVQLTDVSEP